MTTGASGTYAINNVDFILQPTAVSPVKRAEVGIDGNGHPVYPSVREFTIKWDLMHPTDAQQIINAYNSISSTGTLSFDLPEYGASEFVFKTYSGTTLLEPEFGDYFQGYIMNTTLTIMNVRT